MPTTHTIAIKNIATGSVHMLDIGSWFDSVFDMTAIYVVCFCKFKTMIVMSYKLSCMYFVLYLVALLLGEFILFNLISSDR